MSARPHRSEIAKKAFRPAAAPPKLFKFDAHDRAFHALRKVVNAGTGVGVLVGPPLSGKSVVAQRLAESFRNQADVILVDGATQSPSQIVSTMLAGLQFDVALQSAAEMLDLLHVIAVHRTRMRISPILIVENLDRMPPDSLRMISTMAEFTVGAHMAIRMILTGRPACRAILASKEMRTVARRTESTCELGAVSAQEALAYLHLRLTESGETSPCRVLSLVDCERVHELAEGLAGRLDDCAIQVVEQKETRVEPALVISRAGQLVGRYALEDKRIVIGRSYLADIVIDDGHASRFHALLLQDADALVIADLKSANGTFVNSARVEIRNLANDDVISIGRYRLILTNAAGLAQGGEPLQLSDTAISRAVSRLPAPDGSRARTATPLDSGLRGAPSHSGRRVAAI